MYVEYSLQSRFVFFYFPLWPVRHLKIRNGGHAHYVGLVVAYTWYREKQMFVALGKEFDMIISIMIITVKNNNAILGSIIFADSE